MKTIPTILTGIFIASLSNLPAAEPAQSLCPSPFGIGGDAQTAQTPEKWIPQMAAIGIKVNRTIRTKWEVVEPKEGQWDWTGPDRALQCLIDNGMDTGGYLIGHPQWAVKGDPGPGRLTLPVGNLPAWSNYVSETVKHYKGKIKRWEVWNEPPNFTGVNQKAADYGKVVAAAYDAAKAADPDCLIGLAAKSAHINYLERAITGGAKDRFDYITVHPYEALSGVIGNQGAEALFMNIVPNIRKMLARVNPAKANVPVIITELGADSDPVGKNYGVGPDVAAQALVKAYTLGIAQGVDCINWFEGMDGDSGAMGLLDAAGKPRLTHTAMEQMIKHLGQRPAYLGWQLLNDKHYAFLFQGAKGPVLITWAYKGVPDKVDFGKT
ncbi:MAG: endo-1,4-beta-xylanase, partial [Terrimicrobiaceae bacterium]